METRKVYRSGGSTYVISLPKKWADKVGLKEGDSVVVRESGGTLIIGIGETPLSPRKAIIEAEHPMTPADLKLLIISHYLVGYDDITVKFDSGRRLEYKKHIREVIEFLMGLEIAEEYEDRVLLEVFLDQERITIIQGLKRMHLIIKSMLKDALDSIENHDIQLIQDILRREGEIDKLYFLIVRQLKSSVRYQQSAEKLGLLEPRQALGFRIVVKSFERISDHIENLISHYLALKEETVNLEGFKDMLIKVLTLFETASKSAFKLDRELASNSFTMLEQVKQKYQVEENHIFTEGLTTSTALHFKAMLDSLSRIADYSSDIAEIAINMSVEAP